MGAPGIGCIGWGSLLWDPRALPTDGAFADDGPLLPIEFSRVATDGRATLVIDPAAVPIATSWAPLAVGSLDEAIAALGRRERIRPERWSEWIAGQTAGGASFGTISAETREAIAAWLEKRRLDAAVWTALPGRTPDGALEWPTTEALLTHLRALAGEARARAEEYVRRAPPAVRTPRRAAFERELGWLRSDLPANAPTPGAREEPVT